MIKISGTSAKPVDFDSEPRKAICCGDYYEGPLTKREHFAAMAMQGFIAAGSCGMPNAYEVASYSIEYSNALLAELAKS